MIRHAIFAVLMLSVITPSFAQFDPNVAEKSLVKIIVSEAGANEMGVCTGFLWKKKSWIVTSLHAMKLGDKVRVHVVFSGDYIMQAKVIKVYQQGDLVLLEIVDPASIPVNVTPLTTFHSGSLQFGEKIYAIGYNGGSKGNQTQVLEKGHANPETLEFLVREQDKAGLKLLKFPDLNLPIYFLSGSLLPGFSGSPIYNAKGELVGIGDGGLERGLMNVSWCIPAFHLKDLEASTAKILPLTLNSAAPLYSAEVSIAIDPAIQSKINTVSMQATMPQSTSKKEDPKKTSPQQTTALQSTEEPPSKKNESQKSVVQQIVPKQEDSQKASKAIQGQNSTSKQIAIQQSSAKNGDANQSSLSETEPQNSSVQWAATLQSNLKEYDSYSYGDYKFNQTKTRTFEEMHNSAIDPQNMEGFADIFENSGVTMNYDGFNFDVYQLEHSGGEKDPGFTVAIPSGTKLKYDDDFKMFGVDLSSLPQSENFRLYYHRLELHGDSAEKNLDSLAALFLSQSSGFRKSKGLTIGTAVAEGIVFLPLAAVSLLKSKKLKQNGDFLKSYTLNDEWKEAYYYLSSKRYYRASNFSEVKVKIYLNMIYNDKVAFYSVAVCYFPQSEDFAMVKSSTINKIDCVNEYNKHDKSCDFFSAFMNTFVAAHLTTLSSLY